MIEFARLAGIVDPHTLGVLIAFWIRWELWRWRHDKKHDAIDLFIPQEAQNHG